MSHIDQFSIANRLGMKVAAFNLSEQAKVEREGG